MRKLLNKHYLMTVLGELIRELDSDESGSDYNHTAASGKLLLHLIKINPVFRNRIHVFLIATLEPFWDYRG